MYKEILIRILQNERVEVVFPTLQVDIHRLFELRCYQALAEVRRILRDASLEDEDCFAKIEAIVTVIEELGSDAGPRHDFG